MAKKFTKENSIRALKNLIRTDGWKIIRNVLFHKIKEARSRLEGEAGSIKDLTLLGIIQENLSDRKDMVRLPQDLIKQYKDGPQEFPKEFDPYYNDEQLIEELGLNKEEKE